MSVADFAGTRLLPPRSRWGIALAGYLPALAFFAPAVPPK
jgi:hypothetical protein